jgi:NADH-quinone oxidoreductase subunit C
VNPAELAERLGARFPDVLVARGEVTLIVQRDDLVETLRALRDDAELDLSFLSCVTATDWPGTDPRFWVIYQLRSIATALTLRVKVGLPGADPHVPTVTGLFPTANWHEREIWDLYGIVFDGHPDLTRILLPDGWEGHPLRKDEPLGGVDTRYHGAFIPPVDTRLGT